MATKDQEELKKLNAEKKRINDEQKALREKLNAGKAERAEARKAQAACRKDAVSQKAALRDISAKIYSTFKDGSQEAVGKLADELMEVSAELAGTIRKFGETCESEEL
jgi:predicted  nucleic acid-binding Zn-ribbon protein